MSLVDLFRRFAGPLDQLQIPYMATGAVAARGCCGCVPT